MQLRLERLSLPSLGSSRSLSLGKYCLVRPIFIFSLLPHGEPFKVPQYCAGDDINHEVELGVIFNGLGKEHPWQDRIGAYVLLLDMTDKVRLMNAVKTKTPFFTGKVQDGFLVLGDLLKKE